MWLKVIFTNNPGWWFQPRWIILVNGKDYPIYYGKEKMFQTTNQNLIEITCHRSNKLPTKKKAQAERQVPSPVSHVEA